ncbi:MAG: lipopolysaccharide transport periplasmic protein LptA [Rhodanobacter sp.]
MLPALAVARKSDRQQPMSFAAKHTDAYNAPNTVTTLTGNVKITQGSLLLTGDLARIYLDADSAISRVVVTGKPAHIQQLDDNGNLMTGNAAQLDYDNIHEIAVLTGQASVKQQGRGEFHGDKLTYNTQTSQITGDSGGDGLVHGVFLPKPKPVSASTPASPPAAASSSPAPQGHR